ncbi:hypothetical protein PTH_2170 [Pelotomaculum thermopropionicum SI]|uniref:Transcriptional regulator n=1 Tax=Pelotomaculum thermopropionicum (strain DSM 13744 / JCM 10971 / SI) TaxID=370438 RepID=A5D087_PELTS|nr:hypothetical protein PTH_2170 [Pelotomaculum thermopropionicum SI]
MNKNRLDNIQKLLFGYIWLNGSIVCSKPSLSLKLNIPKYLLGKTIKELTEKRWIRTTGRGKGFRLESIKKEVPKYIIDFMEKNFQKYVC